MIRSTLRLALAATALVATQVHAAANVTQVTFSGIVTAVDQANGAEPAPGDTISGSFTLSAYPGYSRSAMDPAFAVSIGESGAGTSPAIVTGASTFSDGLPLAFPSSPSYQYFRQSVQRGNGLDYIEIFAQASAGSESTMLRLEVLQTQDACAAACLFSDPQGGLAVDQPLDIFAPGVRRDSDFWEATSDGTYSGKFELTSLAIVAVPVPEPASLPMLLAGAGVVAAFARRRRAA